jgi:DNA-3-methyladenine glycosylase II
VRTIVYQQLSGKAASTILGRVHGLYSGRAPTPAELLATPDTSLRGAGLSRQKLVYLRDLADRVENGSLPVGRLGRLSDADAIESLVAVKGIGRWTAQVFLMFRLARPDVLPEGDLGIQKAIQRAYGLRRLPTPERVMKIGAAWTPYRSVAAWYLWKSLDNR